MQVVKELLEKNKIALEDGPVPRTGARSNFTSLYVRDPEGNLIEFSEYPRKQKIMDIISSNYCGFFIGILFGAGAAVFFYKREVEGEVLLSDGVAGASLSPRGTKRAWTGSGTTPMTSALMPEAVPSTSVDGEEATYR